MYLTFLSVHYVCFTDLTSQHIINSAIKKDTVNQITCGPDVFILQQRAVQVQSLNNLHRK